MATARRQSGPSLGSRRSVARSRLTVISSRVAFRLLQVSLTDRLDGPDLPFHTTNDGVPEASAKQAGAPACPTEAAIAWIAMIRRCAFTFEERVSKMKSVLHITAFLAAIAASAAPAMACFWIDGGDGQCNVQYELCSMHNDGTGALYVAHIQKICFS